MIYDIVVTNHNGESLTLSLERAELSGLIVLSVEGLGPAKSNINVREFSGVSGSEFSSAKTPSRNIVLSLRFLPTPTIESTRLRTYRFFPNEQKVALSIRTDAGSFYTYGYVESNEPNIFSDYEGTTISIICPNPFLILGSSESNISGNFVVQTGSFSFPFENIGELPTIEFGKNMFESKEFDIIFPPAPSAGVTYPDGAIPVGPTFTLRAVGGAVNNPVIYFKNPINQDAWDYLKFEFSATLPPLDEGDYLSIVCRKQYKSITRVTSTGEHINYIGALTLDSRWPILRQGVNTFVYDTVGPNDGAQYIRLSYEYDLQYSGV